MTAAQEELLKEFQAFSRTAPTAKSIMELIAKRLHEKMTRYNWVGFYLVDPSDPGILLVGPYGKDRRVALDVLVARLQIVS